MNNFESLEMLEKIVNKRIELLNDEIKKHGQSGNSYPLFEIGKIKAYQMILTDIAHLMTPASEEIESGKIRVDIVDGIISPNSVPKRLNRPIQDIVTKLGYKNGYINVEISYSTKSDKVSFDIEYFPQ